MNNPYYFAKVRTFDAAVQIAAAKQEHNGCFYEADGGYVVRWDAKP
jgi:hypothetical protein